MKTLALLIALVLPARARADVSVPGAIGGRSLTCRPEKALPLQRGPRAEVELGRHLSLIFDAQHHSLMAITGELIDWRAPVPDVWADSIDAVIDGGQVIVVFYGFFSGGSALMSFDLLTGRRSWTADVEQLDAFLSESWNVVTVEKRGGEIVLRGDETAGCYVQTFDAKTGRRRASLIGER